MEATSVTFRLGAQKGAAATIQRDELGFYTTVIGLAAEVRVRFQWTFPSLTLAIEAKAAAEGMFALQATNLAEACLEALRRCASLQPRRICCQVFGSAIGPNGVELTVLDERFMVLQLKSRLRAAPFEMLEEVAYASKQAGVLTIRLEPAAAAPEHIEQTLKRIARAACM